MTSRKLDGVGGRWVESKRQTELEKCGEKGDREVRDKERRKYKMNGKQTKRKRERYRWRRREREKY